jgi:hypothetical protein
MVSGITSRVNSRFEQLHGRCVVVVATINRRSLCLPFADESIHHCEEVLQEHVRTINKSHPRSGRKESRTLNVLSFLRTSDILLSLKSMRPFHSWLRKARRSWRAECWESAS